MTNSDVERLLDQTKAVRDRAKDLRSQDGRPDCLELTQDDCQVIELDGYPFFRMVGVTYTTCRS